MSGARYPLGPRRAPTALRPRRCDAQKKRPAPLRLMQERTQPCGSARRKMRHPSGRFAHSVVVSRYAARPHPPTHRLRAMRAFSSRRRPGSAAGAVLLSWLVLLASRSGGDDRPLPAETRRTPRWRPISAPACSPERGRFRCSSATQQAAKPPHGCGTSATARARRCRTRRRRSTARRTDRFPRANRRRRSRFASRPSARRARTPRRLRSP